MDDSTESDTLALARRLDKIATWVRPRGDDLIELLRALGSGASGVGLGMVVDGVLMMGAPGPPEGFAKSVADAAEDAIRELDWSESLRDELLGVFTESEQAIDERISAESEVVKRYGPDCSIDDIAAEDVDQYYSAFVRRSTLDLHDVKIFHDGTEPIEVEHVRVTLSHIGAWWPLKAQGIDVHYQHSPKQSDGA